MRKASLTTLVIIGWFALLMYRFESSSMLAGRMLAGAPAQSPPCNSTTENLLDCENRDSNNNIVCQQFGLENYNFNPGVGFYYDNPQDVFCGGNSDCPTFVVRRQVCDCDHDMDGYAAPGCGGQDCNDFDSRVHPGAEEICANGVDDDCDGDVDFYIDSQECNFWGFWDDEECYCWTATPIIVDPRGNGFLLTGLYGGVNFDLDANGSIERVSWTNGSSDDAFLVLDRNGNGAIDNGTELFGASTPQSYSPFPNGFIALSEFDSAGNGGNANGRIDWSDSVFSSLRLWRDSNHNGISEASELHSLNSLGLFAISLEYSESRRTDKYGNHFRYRATAYGSRGSQFGPWAWDVILLRQQ